MVAKKQKKPATLGGVALGAAKSGQEDLMQVLMLAGISPDQRGKDGKTLAHHAAEYAVQVGDADVLRMLVSYGANIYLKDNRGRDVLDILKANPRLEAEVRSAWVGGSRNLGIKDPSLGKGKVALGVRRGGKDAATDVAKDLRKLTADRKAADRKTAGGISGRLQELRKTEVMSLRRPSAGGMASRKSLKDREGERADDGVEVGDSKF